MPTAVAFTLPSADGTRQTRARLREATSELHRQLEEQLNLLDPALTQDGYRMLLERFYGYYEPFEKRLAAAVAQMPPLSFAIVNRAELLARDLAALGISSTTLVKLPLCTELPRITTLAEVAGCLYVIEGASLGGQVITRTLKRQLGIHERNGGSFFTGEGSLTASRWKRVLEWIAQVDRMTSYGDSLVLAACETFRTFARWCSRQERHA